MDYQNFDIEDLASDDLFIKWVIEGDKKTENFWESLRQSDPDLKMKIDSARALILKIRNLNQIPPKTQLDKIWNNIETTIQDEETKGASDAGWKYGWAIAASVALMLVIAGSWWLQHDPQAITSGPAQAVAYGDNNRFIEYANNTGKPANIRLSDGSSVMLEDQSVLKYRQDYRSDTAREVHLVGEAFFDISKNPQQPFLVYTNEIVTKVLGTSFRVKAYDNEKDIVVSVKEGKVSVFSSKESQKVADANTNVNGVILTPNQQVVYLRKEDSFNKTLVIAPEIITVKAHQYNFKFDNTPVHEVFSILEESYGVEILFDEEVMKNCFITVPLGKETLYEKLKIICRTIGASYELIDAKIVVSSKGC